jgi:RNA recognition motif-containing protein
MNIYISNLSYNVDDADLNDLFAEYGQVTSAKVITDRETGRSRGFGFVEMSNNEEAQKAIDELNQAEYDGKVINVNEAKPKTDKPRSSGGFRGGNSWGGGNGGGRSNGGGFRDRNDRGGRSGGGQGNRW